MRALDEGTHFSIIVLIEKAAVDRIGSPTLQLRELGHRVVLAEYEVCDSPAFSSPL